MAIKYHPKPGTVIRVDYGIGFLPPEMVKVRPAVVISPDIKVRKRLATVVPLSTTEPRPRMPYHMQIDLPEGAPENLQAQGVWVKGDMVCALSFARMDLYRLGRDAAGRRIYFQNALAPDVLLEIRRCVLRSLGGS